jgi:hypothetical protein
MATFGTAALPLNQAPVAHQTLWRPLSMNFHKDKAPNRASLLINRATPVAHSSQVSHLQATEDRLVLDVIVRVNCRRLLKLQYHQHFECRQMIHQETLTV